MNYPLAFHSSVATSDSPTVCRFDTDSFKIGVDTFASKCMVNNPSLLDNLTLTPRTQSVEGISAGLDIAGHGTFVFDIEDDNGSIHTIRITDSLYVPDLKFCLLAPQHWAQEARRHNRCMRIE